MCSATRRTIILTGSIGQAEMISIANYCEQLHRGGQAELCLNMDAVTTCQRAGLDGLLALTDGSAEMTVSVSGARWQHFMVLLSAAPIAEIQQLCDSARTLITTPQPQSADTSDRTPPTR